MTTLRILLADDQIPPSDQSEADFKSDLVRQFGNTPQVHAFMEQCVFMGNVVQALRDAGYKVTTARIFKEAVKAIAQNEFDLAIVDLGWYIDSSLSTEERPSAGWLLCEKIDERAAQRGIRIPQVLFSSRFPTHPELSRYAARRQILPLFKVPTAVVLNSLMATVGFVESTLAAQQTQDTTNVNRFERQLQDLAVDAFREPMSDYRRWTMLALVLVAGSLVSVLAGVGLALYGAVGVATLSSITSLLCTAIAGLLYKRLDSVQKSVEASRREIMLQIQKGAPRDARKSSRAEA